jgi:hypothetical protein
MGLERQLRRHTAMKPAPEFVKSQPKVSSASLHLPPPTPALQLVMMSKRCFRRWQSYAWLESNAGDFCFGFLVYLSLLRSTIRSVARFNGRDCLKNKSRNCGQTQPDNLREQHQRKN